MATTAILNRLLRKAHLFNVDGKSYCLNDFDFKLSGGEKDDA